MKQVALVVAMTVATAVQSANVWPKVNIPSNYVVRMDYYQWDPEQSKVVDLLGYRLSKMSSDLNIQYDENSGLNPGKEFSQIFVQNYNTGERHSYYTKLGCTDTMGFPQQGYVADMVSQKFNPDLAINKNYEFVGKESPAWDPSNEYYRLNDWSPDHQTLNKWIYYRVDTGDVAWEVEPDIVKGSSKLFLYKYGQGYIPTSFSESDFQIKQCTTTSNFLN